MSRFVVIDEDGSPTWDAKKDAPESFATLAAAEKRAKQSANYDAGRTFTIYQAISTATAPVQPARIEKLKFT